MLRLRVFWLCVNDVLQRKNVKNVLPCVRQCLLTQGCERRREKWGESGGDRERGERERVLCVCDMYNMHKHMHMCLYSCLFLV